MSIWSPKLASVLPSPGSPAPVKSTASGDVVLDQPRKVLLQRDITEGASPGTPLWEEMKTHLLDLDMLMEYKLVSEKCVPGVYLLPSKKSLLEWHGVLFLRTGLWKGGTFLFTLFVPDGYPHVKPIVKFRSDVYHPYIHKSNGVVNMARVFPLWDPAKHHICDVISAIRDSFLRDDLWDGDEGDDHIIKDFIKQCVSKSVSTLDNLSQLGEEEGEDLLLFKDLGGEKMSEVMSLIRKGELPRHEVSSPSVLRQLTSQVGRFFDKVLG